MEKRALEKLENQRVERKGGMREVIKKDTIGCSPATWWELLPPAPAVTGQFKRDHFRPPPVPFDRPLNPCLMPLLLGCICFNWDHNGPQYLEEDPRILGEGPHSLGEANLSPVNPAASPHPQPPRRIPRWWPYRPFCVLDLDKAS